LYSAHPFSIVLGTSTLYHSARIDSGCAAEDKDRNIQKV
jgi:hypothetical protein